PLLTDPNARSYLRVTAFTRDYTNNAALVDTGPAVASFRLVPTPYTLDPPLPAQPGTLAAVPPPLAGTWYVGQGPFTDGSHAGLWAYDLFIVDSSLFPDANDPSPNLTDYPSFGQPVHAPVAGTVLSLDTHNDDLPPRSSATGNPNFVYMDIGGDTA